MVTWHFKLGILLCFSQCSAYYYSGFDIVDFLKSVCRNHGSVRILVFTSLWGGLKQDFQWWQFIRRMYPFGIGVQVSGLDGWCTWKQIPEGRKNLNIFIYEGSREGNSFIKKCSDQQQFGPRHNWLFLASHLSGRALYSLLDSTSLRLDSNVFVGIVCLHGYAELIEVYKIGKDMPVVKIPVGNSTPTSLSRGKLNLDPLDYKYRRRQDLRGYRLRAVTVLVNNFYIEANEAANGNWEVTGGYFGSLFMHLKDLLNFSYSLHCLDGYSYGNVERDDHNWTGLIGMLQRNEADVSACEVSVSTNRLDVIDFTLPIHSAARRLYAHRGAQILFFDYYVSPFSISAWLALVVFLITVVFVKVILLFFLALYDYKEVYNVSFPLFTFITIFLQQGTEDPRRFPLRVFQWSVSISFLIVSIAYGAKLTSTSTVTQDEIPLKSMRDVLDYEWNFCMVKDSFVEKLFQDADPDTVEGGLWNSQLKIKPHRFVNGIVDGLQKVITDPNYVFMGQEDSSLQAMGHYFSSDEACQIGMLPSKYYISPLSFGLQRNSPYREIINFHLLRLFEIGVEKRLLKKWIPGEVECQKQTHEAAELIDILPTIIIYLLGVSLSCLLLLVEIYLGQKKNRGRNVHNRFKRLYLVHHRPIVRLHAMKRSPHKQFGMYLE